MSAASTPSHQLRRRQQEAQPGLRSLDDRHWARLSGCGSPRCPRPDGSLFWRTCSACPPAGRAALARAVPERLLAFSLGAHLCRLPSLPGQARPRSASRGRKSRGLALDQALAGGNVLVAGLIPPDHSDFLRFARRPSRFLTVPVLAGGALLILRKLFLCIHGRAHCLVSEAKLSAPLAVHVPSSPHSLPALMESERRGSSFTGHHVATTAGLSNGPNSNIVVSQGPGRPRRWGERGNGWWGEPSGHTRH